MSSHKPENRTLKEIKKHKEKRKNEKEKILLKKIKEQKLKEEQTHATEESTSSTTTREYPTISIAVAGSILENAQKENLRVCLVEQIARAACIYQVDEVIIYDDYGDEANARKSNLVDSSGEVKSVRNCCVQFGRILQYLECPQYLRKHFFPRRDDLTFAGEISPLEPSHHLTQDNTFAFREGISTNKPVKKGRGSQINVGLQQDVHVDRLIDARLRCTVKLHPQEEGSKKLKGILVSRTAPRLEADVYWGYDVRLANCLSQVFSQCPYKDGYDLSIGTSDKGSSIDEFEGKAYKHLLITFGGLRGIEAALENDSVLTADDPATLFDYYLNASPDQGTRTIRTEEAVMVTLSALRPKIPREIVTNS